jgi:hypothetical protein
MNPAEQRARHYAVTAIARRQDDLELVATALARELVTVREQLEAENASRRELATRTVAALEETAAADVARAERQLRYTDLADTGLRRDVATLEAWRARGLVGRLRWILRGL